MPLNDARAFVSEMRENPEFRKKVLQTTDSGSLTDFLEEERLSFDRRELIWAMAECMAQMEQMNS